MKTLPALATLSIGVLALLACSSPEKKEAWENVEVSREVRETTAPHRARGESAEVRMNVTVVAVDAEKRRITLRGPEGRTGEYTVSDQVRRLAEIKAGDRLAGEYQVAALVELREPTAEEKATPLVALKETDRALPGFTPKGGILRIVRVVTTLTAIDTKARAVTLQGPLGGQVTVPVEKADAFAQLKVGQHVIVTFGEALSFTLQPR